MGKGSKRRPQEADDEFVTQEWARLFNTKRGQRDIKEIAQMEKDAGPPSNPGDEGTTTEIEGSE